MIQNDLVMMVDPQYILRERLMVNEIEFKLSTNIKPLRMLVESDCWVDGLVRGESRQWSDSMYMHIVSIG